MFDWALSVIWLRGCAVSDDGRELARRLRDYGDPIGVSVAERLERGVLRGTAIVGTSRPEAIVLLNVLEQWLPERLRDVARSLRAFVAA